MTTRLQDFRELVDLLTQTRTVDVRQEIDEQVQITKANVQPLIGQLRTAIASSVATSGQGSSLPSERNMLDSDALELYDRIEDGAVKLLGIYSDSVPFLLPEQNIRQASVGVYKQELDGKLDEHQLGRILRDLKAWVTAINRILNPPVTLELMGKCPNCDNTHAKLGVTGESGRALIVEWHNPDQGFSNALQNCFARCRACGLVWNGDLQLRELAYVLEGEK